MGRKGDIMGRFRQRPASTTCLVSSQPRAKRRITCRRGKEHPFLPRQRSGSLSRVLPRVPRAQRKSRKRKLENRETPKKADLFVHTALYGISRQSLARVQQLRWLKFVRSHSWISHAFTDGHQARLFLPPAHKFSQPLGPLLGQYLARLCLHHPLQLEQLVEEVAYAAAHVPLMGPSIEEA